MDRGGRAALHGVSERLGRRPLGGAGFARGENPTKLRYRNFLPLAEEELNEAARFYDERSPGLGQDFLEEIKRTIDSIAAHPDSGYLISQNLRRRIVRRFPFGVIYAVETDRIIIVAVMHLRRRPGYWKGRV